MNTHTWPEQNTASLAVVEDEMVEPVLEAVRRLDEENKDVGIRAFSWNVEAMY
jgi:hypothetical protein